MAFLVEHCIALWDVLEVCAREGSLDAQIAPGSERPNDILAFLREHSDVQTVVLNGGKAFKLFQDLIASQLVNLGRTIEIVQMPSTSPAHTVSFATKLSQWKPVIVAAV